MKKPDVSSLCRKYLSFEYACRLCMTVGGVLLSGFAVGFFQIANFGTDPFTVFATGIAAQSGSLWKNTHLPDRKKKNRNDRRTELWQRKNMT